MLNYFFLYNSLSLNLRNSGSVCTMDEKISRLQWKCPVFQKVVTLNTKNVRDLNNYNHNVFGQWTYISRSDKLTSSKDSLCCFRDAAVKRSAASFLYVNNDANHQRRWRALHTLASPPPHTPRRKTNQSDRSKTERNNNNFTVSECWLLSKVEKSCPNENYYYCCSENKPSADFVLPIDSRSTNIITATLQHPAPPHHTRHFVPRRNVTVCLPSSSRPTALQAVSNAACACLYQMYFKIIFNFFLIN